MFRVTQRPFSFTHACYSSTHLFSGSDAGPWWNPSSVIRPWDGSSPRRVLDKSGVILRAPAGVSALPLVRQRRRCAGWGHLPSLGPGGMLRAHALAFRRCLASEGWRSVELAHPVLEKKKKSFPLLQLNNLSAASLSWWQFSPKLALFISPPVRFFSPHPSHCIFSGAAWYRAEFLCTNVTEHQFRGFYRGFSQFLTELRKNRAQQNCRLSVDVWLAPLTLEQWTKPHQ